MAPLRQPTSLQDLCIDKGSQFIASSAVENHHFHFPMQWEKLCIYIKNYIPPVIRTSLFHSTLKKLTLIPAVDKFIPRTLTYILHVLLHPRVDGLSFSDLIYGGEATHEVLDTFDHIIAEAIPYLPYLTYLDLSTHKIEETLPYCKENILFTIGQNCPKLRVLDLNNNSRITGEHLKYLAPGRDRYGCPHLEEIFIQETSVIPSDIMWLLREFPYLRIVSYRDMGTILQKIMSHHRRYRRREPRPTFNLTHVDNTESTSGRTDRDIIKLISDTCPYADNVKLRICDEDSAELNRLPFVTKLELRFYTGIYHPVGQVTMRHLRLHGHLLSSLTMECKEITSYHVSGIASNCFNLEKLYLYSNYFIDDDQSFRTVPNVMKQLEVLSIRLGQHEMDEAPAARFLIKYLVYPCFKLRDIFLLIRCVDIHHSMFIKILNNNPLSNLKTFICDAPRRNLDLPMIPLGIETAVMLIESCISLTCIGNLISWQVSESEVEELKNYVQKKNYNVEVIHSVVNKMNKKYF